MSKKTAMGPMVMIIIAASDVSGPAKGVFQLMESFRDRGADVAFRLYNFSVNGAGQSRFLEAAKEKGFEVGLFEQKGRNYLSLLRQARSETLRNNFNIVQTHGYKPSIIGLYLKFFCGVKWVCFMHGTTTENLKTRLYHALDNVVQRCADKVVLVSESQRMKVWRGRDRQRVCVVQNAVNKPAPAGITCADEVRKGLGLGGDARLVAVVGRLSPEKGVDVFLRAFSFVARSMPAAHAVIVGDGHERAQLERQSNEQGLKDRVHFTGHTSKPYAYIAASDLVVIPSRSEGIPNVALEAMVLKRPLVATDVGGMPEIVIHGRSGLLVLSGDAKALSEAMVRVLSEPAFAARLASEGQRRVEGYFSPKRRAEAIKAVYDEMLEHARRTERFSTADA